MAIQYESIKTHWNYFLALERDFSEIARFVEPCEQNHDTFSIELARLIMTSAQEVDVVLKSLCLQLEPESNPSGIRGYHDVIERLLPELLSEKVQIPRYGISCSPWSSWTQDSPPIWWTANNKIKHDRQNSFNRASLKNGYNAIGALLIVVSYFYRQERKKSDQDTKWSDVTDGLVSDLRLVRLDSSRYRPVATYNFLRTDE